MAFLNVHGSKAMFTEYKSIFFITIPIWNNLTIFDEFQKVIASLLCKTTNFWLTSPVETISASLGTKKLAIVWYSKFLDFMTLQKGYK